MQGINGQWFYDKLADKGQSLRALARHLDVDPATLTRTFQGKRNMTMDEAGKISIFLGVPVSEVLKNSGIPLDFASARGVQLVATIDENGLLQELAEPADLPKEVDDKARLAIGVHYKKKAVAAQVRASSGPLALLDDAVVLFLETDGINPEAMGGLSIVEVEGGRQVLARIERARKTGEAMLSLSSGETREGKLQRASAVIAIIP